MVASGPRPSPVWCGIAGRCPACGRGRLFNGFLRLAKSCNVCSLDYAFADAGDGPAVFVILIVGFIVVGSALYVELAYEPPMWVHAVLWPPLLLALALGLLRFLKGLMIALQFRNDARLGKLASKQ